MLTSLVSGRVPKLLTSHVPPFYSIFSCLLNSFAISCHAKNLKLALRPISGHKGLYILQSVPTNILIKSCIVPPCYCILSKKQALAQTRSDMIILCLIYNIIYYNIIEHNITWGRGWMTKASGVGERKGRGELRRDCHHRVAALFVPTRMQQWYMIYNNDIYGGGGRGGPFRVKKHVMSLGSPGILAKARRL